MSEQSIKDKSLVIRNETQEYANTRGRVADVLDDINDTKANKTDVNDAIDAILNELDITEADLRAYIDHQNALQDVEIGKKLNPPTNAGNYIFQKTSIGGNVWKTIYMTQNQMPFWNNGTFENSPVYVVGGRIGIGEGAPTESLHVNGSVRADTCIINQTTANTVPNKLWNDGSALWFTNASGVNKKISLSSAYKAKSRIDSANIGTINIFLERKTELAIASSSNNTYVFTLEAPIQDEVNEYVVVAKAIGITAIAFTFPTGLKWRGKTPIFNTNTWTIIIEQVYINNAWEIYGSAIEHLTS